jgi:hypothetical protein
MNSEAVNADVGALAQGREVAGGINSSTTSEKTLEHRNQDLEQAPRHSEDSKAVDVVPDGGYGWVVVACVFMISRFSFPNVDRSCWLT